MKRLIILTLILVASTAYITVKYFKSLNTSGVHAGNIMRKIPEDAAVVFEFTNDKGFFDIFTDNTLLGSLIGDEKTSELDTVRRVLFGNPLLEHFFDGSNVFISLHPSKGNDTEILLTATAAKDFDLSSFETLAKQKKQGILITPLTIDEKKGYTVYFTALKKRFYIINTEGSIFAASFSKPLIQRTSVYKADKEKQAFMLLPDKQNSTSLANLYVNYQNLSALFTELFKNNTSDIFKSFRLLQASSALNLNYKTDAIMFNGYTTPQEGKPASYLNLFIDQQPVENHLKEIFPSTTAYAMSMAVSDANKFTAALSDFHNRAGLKAERDSLMSRIKAETGINLMPEFDKLLGNEFAVVTTRYREKFAIIMVKDGSKLRPFMTNISTMINDDLGEFNYNKIPYFLLGDAFNSFRRPYFRIIDNYLVLANSQKEAESFNDTYFNRKFLNKTEHYSRFDDLLAERSNAAFYIYFKNAQQILKFDLKDEFYDTYKNNKLSVKNFYGASYQFAATDKSFYTNFCMLQNPSDTTNSSNSGKNQK